MKKNSTKRAMLFSLLSLVLCVSMLVGTTFAWFTDSVTSVNNIIKSGNLDVELEYLDGTTWKKVTDTTNVFDQETLWEPGHTEVVYLRVSNLGTLALKYNLGVNIVSEIESINVYGDAFRLSDYIEFGAIEDVDTPYADRDTARAAVTNAAVLSTGYTKAGSIEPGAAADCFALVVYMPESVGNEANYRTGEVAPQITLGINLMATQYTFEEDSFDNQYDKDATFAGTPFANTTTMGAMPVVTTINNNTVTLDTAYVFSTTETAEQAQKNDHRYWHADFVAYFDQDVDDNTFGLAGQYDAFSTDWLAFEIDGVGGIPAGTNVRMLMDVAGITINYEELCSIVKKFSCGAFAIDQAAMEGKTLTVELRIYETLPKIHEPHGSCSGNSVNCETGEYVTIGTYSYTFGDKKITTPDELAKALAAGGKYIAVANIEADGDNTITVPAGVTTTLDLNGKTISFVTDDADKNDDGNFTSADNEVAIDVRGTLNVKNGTMTIKHTDADFGWNACTEVFYVAFNGTLNVEDAWIENLGGSSMAYAIDLVNANNVTLNVKNSVLKSTYIPVRVFNNGSGMNNVTIEGTTLEGVSRAFWVHVYSSVDNGNNGVKDATLNLDIFGNGNVFKASNPNRIIEFGFDDEINFDANGNQI